MKICKKCGGSTFNKENRCVPCRAKSRAECDRKNAEKIKAYKEKYRAENKEKIRLANLKYYAENPLVKKTYRQENADSIKAYMQNWRKNNPDSCHKHSSARRLSILKSKGVLSKDLFKKLYAAQKGKCACCRADLSALTPHMDHINPLSVGGSNTDDNIQLLCKSCNLSKGAKHPIDFMQSRGFLL